MYSINIWWCISICILVYKPVYLRLVYVYIWICICKREQMQWWTNCNTLQHCDTLPLTCTGAMVDKITLQHTATHCMTLQHSATLCNTLQHSVTHVFHVTATHCRTLQHTATNMSRYNDGQDGSLHREVRVWWWVHWEPPHDRSHALCPGLQGLFCCSVLQYVALCCTVLHCVALCCTVLHCVEHHHATDLMHFVLASRVFFCCSVLYCGFVVCCSVLQCAAVCCSVLQCVFVSKIDLTSKKFTCCVCYSLLQCVAVCCTPVSSWHTDLISILLYVCFCLHARTRKHTHTHTATYTHTYIHTHAHNHGDMASYMNAHKRTRTRRPDIVLAANQNAVMCRCTPIQ